MSLHALLARAEEAQREAEADVAECSKALDMLKVSTDGRKKDAATYKRLAVRTRGMIEALNDLDPKAREALDLASFFAAQSDAPAEDEVFDELEIDPPPAPEAPKIEPEAPKIAAEAPNPAPSASLPPASSPLQDRVLAALNRARGTGPFASVDLADLRKTLGVAPSKLTGAFQALADAGRIQKVKPSKTSEPGWATYKVLDAVEQAA